MRVGDRKQDASRYQWLCRHGDQKSTPTVPWRLDASAVEHFDRRLLLAVVPEQLKSPFVTKFSVSKNKRTETENFRREINFKLRSNVKMIHRLRGLLCRLYEFAVTSTWDYNAGPDNRRYLNAVMCFLRAARRMWARSFPTDDAFDKACKKFNQAHKKFMEMFPSHMNTIVFHLMLHIPDQIKRYGPLHYNNCLWLEQAIRIARSKASEKNRSLVSINNSHRQAVLRQDITFTGCPEFQRPKDKTSWKAVDGPIPWQDVKHHLSEDEKRACLDELDVHVDAGVGLFEVGDAIRYYGKPFKTIDACKRQNKTYAHRYVTVNAGGQRFVGHMSKIVCWRQTPVSCCHYLYKVHLLKPDVRRNLNNFKWQNYRINVTCYRQNGREGEFYQIKHTDFYHPVLIPVKGQLDQAKNDEHHVFFPLVYSLDGE
jgi:hypothetical protein